MTGFVVTLSDGQILTPAEIRWPELKAYLKEQGLLIASMYLQLDDASLHVPGDGQVYYYAQKVQALLGGRQMPQQYYGIGTSNGNPEEVTIYWWSKDGATTENRKVDKNHPSFIINEV